MSPQQVFVAGWCCGCFMCVGLFLLLNWWVKR